MADATTTATEPQDNRVDCPACDLGWARNGRGRCRLCLGTALVAPGTASTLAGAVPEPGPVPTLHQGAGKPPHIGRGVLVAQRDVRARGGAERTSELRDGSSYSSAEEIIALGGDTLLALGVVATVEGAQLVGDGRLKVLCQLEHPESGEVWQQTQDVSIDMGPEQTVGQAERGAVTSAFAYFLVRVLAMPRGYRDGLPLDVAASPVVTPPSKAKVEARDPEADAQSILAAIAAAKTNVELTAVRERYRQAIKRRQIPERFHARITEALSERQLVCTANDANRAAEGPQTGRAA